MSLYFTLLLEFLLISSSILLFFNFRAKIGLAPLYILLGSLQYLQTLAGTLVNIKIFGDLVIYPGSAIIFCAGLFAVLLIYIKEGVSAARNLIIGLVISNILLSVFFAITHQQELVSGVNTIDSPSIFSVNHKNFIKGTLILLFDYLLMVVLYQFLVSNLKKTSLFLILFISLLLTLIFDAVAFNFAFFYGTPIFKTSLLSHLIVKPIAALVFSILLYLCVRYKDTEKTKEIFITNQDRDVFSILNYKKKYEDLKFEKEQVEKKLTSQLETTLNNSSDGFMSLDTNWCYTYINELAAEFLGKSPESLIGKHIWTEFPEGLDLPFYKAYHKAAETQETLHFEDYYESLDKWFENRVYPSPEGLTIYFTDITEKKKADANNQMLLSLIETSDDFIGLTTLDGKPIYLNANGRKLVGLEVDEALPTYISDFFPEQYHDVIVNEYLSKIYESNKWKGEARFKNFKTEDFVPIEMAGFLINDNKTDKPIALGVVAIDITERKLIRKNLEFANAELSKTNTELSVLRDQLEQENVYLRNELDLVFNYEDMVYGSAEFSNVLTEVEKVAPTNATVLLLGESGTGKELLARAIHNTSLRNNKPLIKVNCSAIPRELIESELFGHKKGSFTGAFSDKIGKFELADGGTLFLDEIGELPLDMQPKILRFLQEGEIEIVGGTGLKKLDVRVIAATNRNLKEEIEKKQFREDLYFRLNVFPIEVPSLKKRKDDIPLLVEHFVDKFNKAYDKNIKYIPEGSMNQLKSYNWPGNIRELENLIERASILSMDETLVIPGFESRAQKSKQPIIGKDLSLDAIQRNHILQILEQCNWKISGAKGASTLLDLKPSTLRDKMKKLGISKPTK